MFVRWKWRKPAPPRSQHSLHQPSAHWSAVLVESRRVEGKPRQFVVQHLASIADDVRGYEYSQVAFWQQAFAKLDALALDAAQRERMEAALCQKVPRPAPQVLAELGAELAARERRRAERLRERGKGERAA